LEEADINGRFLVRNDQAWNQPLGAEYVYVNFSLPLDAPLITGDVYVYGGLSNMDANENFRMTWNDSTSAYELRVLLKQGYYNYMYATRTNYPRERNDLARLEGARNQTENEYQVLVYLRNQLTNADELVGIRFLNSRN